LAAIIFRSFVFLLHVLIKFSLQGDWILFTHEGGVDVGDVDAKAEKLLIPVDLSEYPSNEEIATTLLKKVTMSS
jgi:succinyl-CoA synthetase beta subunit